MDALKGPSGFAAQKMSATRRRSTPLICQLGKNPLHSLNLSRFKRWKKTLTFQGDSRGLGPDQNSSPMACRCCGHSTMGGQAVGARGHDAHQEPRSPNTTLCRRSLRLSLQPTAQELIKRHSKGALKELFKGALKGPLGWQLSFVVKRLGCF